MCFFLSNFIADFHQFPFKKRLISHKNTYNNGIIKTIYMENITKTLIILFQNKIQEREISFFRGAVIDLSKSKSNILYHNHISDSFNYTYPKIQYKRIDGKAAIVCIKEGIEAVEDFLSKDRYTFRLGEKSINMIIESTNLKSHNIKTVDNFFYYQINRWLPLNSNNYQSYLKLEKLSDKISFLENILTANLLSFTKGIGLYINSEITCELTLLSEPHLIIHKKIQLMSFNAEFKCNLFLPDYIGIGKSTSLGFGIVTQIEKNKKI